MGKKKQKIGALSAEGVLNQMTAKLVQSTTFEFEEDALNEWADIFDHTVGITVRTKEGLEQWDNGGRRFVLHVVALTARKARQLAEARDEVMITAEALREAADTEIRINRSKHCPEYAEGVLGVWCPEA